MLEADHQFRRVNGHLHLPKLRLVILVLGTYWAQRPAFRRPRLHTAVHGAERQDHEGQAFRQVIDPNLRFQGVGRLGLEPRTGGL